MATSSKRVVSMKTIDKLLYRLKSSGPQTAKILAEEFGLTTMGVRQHLLALEADSLIDHEDKKAKVGRPARYFFLTEKGHGRFPDSHGDLTLQILNSVEQVFGEQGLDKLVAHREQVSMDSYQAMMAEAEDVEKRLQLLCQRRSEEGYMADWFKREEDYYLVENHCPICAAATACQNLCRSELNMFQTLLSGYKVTRVEHIVEGARRCAYQITPSLG